jgi:integrase
MARQINKLTPVAVSGKKKAGYYADGNNLYLQVVESGAKTWIFRYRINGKSREMGLGGVNSLTLADARLKAADYRKLLTEGIDPLAARKEQDAKNALAKARGMTFEQCAEAYMEAHKSSWQNEKHVWQWRNTMERFAYPALGKLPVQDIDVALVMKVLEPLWNEKTETASRVRGRIESVLDWASAREYRTGENPARWRGKLENLLPAPSKIQKVVHHPALPYADMADFMAALRTQNGVAALALELVILTATRTSETILAKWSEFDLKNKVWVLPSNRMKMRKEHRVPLSEPALKILKRMADFKVNDYVFTNNRHKPLSNMAMLKLMHRMGRDDLTVHGFRSSFRDWCAEQTNYAREVAEAALAHAVGSAVEAAYRRGDLFDKRRLLMDEWARYCSQPKASKGKVLKIRG